MSPTSFRGDSSIDLRWSAMELLQLAYDLVGIKQPSAHLEGSKALQKLKSGTWLEPDPRGKTTIPYVGELWNAGRLPTYHKALEEVITHSSRHHLASDFAQGLQQLRRALDSVVPDGQLWYISGPLEHFLTQQRVLKLPPKLPNIRETFDFTPPPSRMVDGEMRIYKRASGRLGIPGKVQTHRSEKAQTMSHHTGMDAGHLIADRFGAPGDARNLSLQNWIMNRYGSWWALEDHWADRLRHGWGIKVTVTDVFVGVEKRPLYRDVEWEELSPLGGRWEFKNDNGKVHYANFSSTRERQASERFRPKGPAR